MASSGAPYRMLYSNDLTNTLSCVSPWHKARQPFGPELLEASIDEVAGTGVDAHLLQPGLCNVPLWKSTIYPVSEHADWYKERFGSKLDPYAQFVLDGGDIAQVFIDRCRKTGQAPFISFRLNDAHHKEWIDAKKGDKIPGSASQGLSKFYADHLDDRLAKKPASGRERVFNWAVPEVREHKLALIAELCENYDFDGLELDFLRTYSYFDLDKTTVRERFDIMTTFVGKVREALDRSGRGGRRRWLCARVPCYKDSLDPLGLDLRGLVNAGLDMVNASSHYFTTQYHDLAAIRRMTPGAKLYLEICHSIWNGAKLEAGYDTFAFRRATKEQIYTAAHLAYARGADGMSAFNFAYYRDHGSEGRGPFAEPPFEVFQGLRDPEFVARQPQHWFRAPGWRGPGCKPTPVPRNFVVGKPQPFVLDLAPPAGGWKQGGRLRIENEQTLAGSRWSAKLNGAELAVSDNVDEPYANPYPGLLGKPESRRAWTVPLEKLVDGVNRLEITLVEGEPATVAYLDLGVT
jgi:hypothetical protein